MRLRARVSLLSRHEAGENVVDARARGVFPPRMLAPHSCLLVLAGLAAATLLGAFVWRRQNAARAIGGVISVPKVVWLAWTVFTWGILCPILALDPYLDRYYFDHVIGGPGSFMVPAESYETFAQAVLRKLILEIASNEH